MKKLLALLLLIPCLAYSQTGPAVLINGSGSVSTLGNATGNAASAGGVGEVYQVNCPNQANSATVTFTTATPTVVTWTGIFPTANTPSTLSAWTCPINFTNSGGALPTGVTAGTTYFIIGSTMTNVTNSTFQIADTAAHALAASNAIAVTVAGSGTQTGIAAGLLTTATVQPGAAMSVPAGDWDCVGNSEYTILTAVTGTQYASGVSLSQTSIGSPGNNNLTTFPSGSLGTTSPALSTPPVQELFSTATNLFLADKMVFSAGTASGSGLLRCRRMR